MSRINHIQVPENAELPGVRVIGFQGELHADMTPARRGPIYVDAENRLLRIVSVQRTASGHDARVETTDPPLPHVGILPGYGTRLGPWSARLDDQLILLGPSELGIARRLKARAGREEPPNVEQFVRWLATSSSPPKELTCQRIGDGAAWYCSRAEGFALWERLHRVVQQEFFKAVCAGKIDDLEDASWWLSRATLSPTDMYLAATGLRRAASADWRVLLREGLRLPNEKDWKQGLKDAEYSFRHPPTAEAEESVDLPANASPRNVVRNLFKVAS
jgi:hypothetical protein